VSGNESGSRGGGIISVNLYDTPRTIRNSTIVGNEAGTATGTTRDDQGGAIYAHLSDAAGYGADQDDLVLSSTIVASNSPEDLANTGDDGEFELDFSLIEDPGGATTTEDPAGSNIFGQDPQLGPLASNGGRTETHLPALSSPAIDAGISNGLATDQRGLDRTVDRPEVPNRSGSDATDIGSVEVQLQGAVAGAVADTANCKGVEVKRTDGTEGDDSITGTDLPDAIYGLGGDDLLKGVIGADCVIGGPGIDYLKGGRGRGPRQRRLRPRQGQGRRRQGQAQGRARQGQARRRGGRGQAQGRSRCRQDARRRGQGPRRRGPHQLRRQRSRQGQLRRRRGQGHRR